MKSYEKDSKLQSRILAMSADESDSNNERIRRGALHRLRSYKNYWKNVKQCLMKLILTKLKKYSILVFAKFAKRRVTIFSNSSVNDTRGSLLLEKVKFQREEIQSLLRETIAETSLIKQRLEVTALHEEQRSQMLKSSAFALMEEGMDHARLGKTALRLLYEGDGMARAAKFDMARNLYEAQLIIIRSRSKHSGHLYSRNLMCDEDVKLLAFTHGRLGKLFFLQNRLDRSMVEFDRQLSLASEVDDEYEIADAHLGLGSAYLSRGDLDEATKYLDTAQSKFLMIGCFNRRMLALKALIECFERKYEPELAAGYAFQISEMDDKLQQKFIQMRGMLKSMTDRLVHSSSADIEKVVNIERLSTYAFGVQTKIKDLEASIPFAEDDLIKKQKIYNDQVKLMDDIENELKVAYATEETTMRTNLLLDLADVVVDVEELKSRLEARKITEKQRLMSHGAGLQKAEAILANIHDEIESMNADIQLENCDLIQRTQKTRTFRSVAFDKANAAGDSILGRNTGGIETVLSVFLLYE